MSAVSKGDIAFNNIALVVTDMDRSVAWYQDVLGFEVVSTTYFDPIKAKVTFMRAAGLSIELLAPEDVTTIPELYVDPPAHAGYAGYKALVFDVADLPAFTDSLHAKGVTVVWANQPLNDAGLLSTLFRDPCGNLINAFNRP
jgi:catechol 2,3-dioxygenase-like lactoylglutathione lyase family enzyme